MELISGEKFQRLADVSIITQKMKEEHTSLGDVKIYIFLEDKIKKAEKLVLGEPKSQKFIQKIKDSLHLNRLPSFMKIYMFKINNFLYERAFSKIEKDRNSIECIKLDITPILNNAKIIFVKSDLLDRFFTYIYPYLKQKFFLISHNSARAITKKYRKYLNDNKIIRWYSENCHFSHPKLVPIPLGIANAYWEHGNEVLVKKAMNFPQKKKEKAYSNFDIKTNLNHRLKVFNLIKNNPFVINSSKKSFFDYLLDLSSCKYSVTPRGFGQDCHRLWESLYLGCIPIIDDRTLYKNFTTSIWTGTPIIFIDNWKKLSYEFAVKSVKKMKFKEDWRNNLNFKYWKKLIENERRLLSS